MASSNLEKKKKIVEELKEQIKKKEFILFYDFSGLDAEKIFEIKKKIRKNGASWKVYKNSLLQQVFLVNLTQFKKNNALVFCHFRNDDYLAVLKTFFLFSREELGEQESRFQKAIEINQDRKIVLLPKSLLEKWSQLEDKNMLLISLTILLNSFFLKLIKLLEKI